MKQMQCKIVIILFLVLLGALSLANASVVMGPQFFIKIEITNLGIETITRPDGSAYTRNFVEFKILEFTQGSSSRLKVGDIIKQEISKKSAGLVKIGDKLIAGVEIGSSMGPAGPVEFVLYSPIKRENGTDLLPFFN